MTRTSSETRSRPPGAVTRWFDPVQVARAVDDGDETVVLNGICFTVERGQYFDAPASGKRAECALLRREDGGFVPRGYVMIREV